MSEKNSSGIRTDGLKAMGFEAGTVVFSSDPRFTVDDLKTAVFSTRYSSRVTVPVQLSHDDLVQVSLHRVHVVFAEDGPTNAPAERPKTYHETPEWRFDGWVEDVSSRFNGQPVRGYIVGVSDDTDTTPCRVYIQLISDSADPDGEITYQDGDDRPEN
ncbi:hypothetical protein [Streptomyces canus]|uniref:hypothetical protein n=1 Tax=Streptomyces canus TaxID=58343 RepID=UPI0038642E4F|nr:hypothetical protein OH824_20540 [Streptomyces canus]